MSGDPSPAAAARPWWAPLLGVGSMGLGGLQAMGGVALLVAGMQVEAPASTTLFLAGMAWLLPGAALAVGGIGLTTGARWGRWLSVGAVLLAAAAVLPLALRREAIAPALADLVEYGRRNPGIARSVSGVMAKAKEEQGRDPVETLRDPAIAADAGTVYTGICCCPGLPWQLLVLLACLPPWGARLVRRGG